MRSVWLVAGLIGTAVPLAAQDRSDSLVVHPGAAVRVWAPAIGAQGRPGKFASATVRNTLCYGVAVTLDGSSTPSLVLLKGITRLEVDRRTNDGVAVVGLEPPADSDWTTIDLGRLRAQDKACAVRGSPAD